MPKTMKLLGSTESKKTKDKNGQHLLYLEITEVVLVNGNIANNDYQQDSRILYTFISNKSFSELLDISPKIDICISFSFRIFIYQSMVY